MFCSVITNAFAFSFTGNLTNDNEVQLFNFTTSSLSDVTLRTWSYAGGTNANGDLISSGGFDPVISLFDDLGDFIDENDDGIDVSPDPISDNPYDSLITINLGVGDYTVAIMQYPIFAVGPTLADGFSDSGLSFDERTSSWALDIEGVDTAILSSTVTAIPVPAAMWLFGSGVVGLIGVTKRSSKVSALLAKLG